LASGPKLTLTMPSQCCGVARRSGLSRIAQLFVGLKRRCAD
jgi:hypothetical protein